MIEIKKDKHIGNNCNSCNSKSTDEHRDIRVRADGNSGGTVITLCRKCRVELARKLSAELAKQTLAEIQLDVAEYLKSYD